MKFSTIITPLVIILLFIFIVNGLKVEDRRQTFCQIDRCLTCIGRYCTTTCRGLNCKDCPIGDCCNGTNCNICRGSTCCHHLECNNCVLNCLETCPNKTNCHYECFQKCIPAEELEKGKLIIVNQIKNYLPVNVTTVINVTNTITNENHIDNPVIVNSTNVFNRTVNEASLLKNITVTDDDDENSDNGFVNEEEAAMTKIDCCTVVHPRICRQYRTQNHCFIGKHRECSSLCLSKFIHIIKTSQNNHNNTINDSCIFVGVTPYFFCGNYKIENCDGCYECSEKGNCQKSSGCGENCRHSLIRDNLYNRIFIDDRST